MNLFDKLNLRPQERRLVVVVGIVVFIVINFLLVFPMFGEFGKLQQRTKDARDSVNKFETEIKKKPLYQKELTLLQGDVGFIPSEDAALRLYQDVNSQANLTGLGYNQINQGPRMSGTKSNAFFDETSVTVNIRTGEKELIDFLNRLTDKELMIRAKSLDVGPDPTKMLLQGSITLVKSFQRKPPAKAAAVPKSAPKTPAPKTAAPPPTPKPTATPAAKTPTPPATAGTTNRSKKTP